MRSRARAHRFTSTYHTGCWSLTLLYTVVMATPLREDSRAATLVKSACPSSTSLSFSLSLSVFHTHTHTFLFFHCQPFLFVSLHYFFFLTHCPSPPLLASPLAHLSARLSPLPCYLFIFSPPASRFQAECKYVISLLKSSSCLCLTFVWRLPIHSEDISVGPRLSLSLSAILRDTEYICD